MRQLKAALKSLAGSNAARRNQRQARAVHATPLNGLGALIRRAPSEGADDSPVFIFSAGWRSGSTLLQRMVCSDHTTLMWGEPYDLCEIIQTLARIPRPVTQDWPPEAYFLRDHDPDRLTHNWIANLYPALPDLRDALRATLCRLFEQPALASGAVRWGLKEVRFGLEEATFLHWLYPNAKFLMIHRNVEDAFRSYQNFSPAMDWYGRWPFAPASTPFAFARHRQHILSQFPDIAKLTGGMIVSYEDLIRKPAQADRIAQYCGIEIAPQILDRRVQGRQAATVLTDKRLSRLDKVLLCAGTSFANRRFSRHDPQGPRR
ncbi:sulfotransferase [Rhodobacteraceae bacterium KMM 6894]|nr:sulfotransferase [Rhodobacteraceae bacterium KMM 6894]